MIYQKDIIDSSKLRQISSRDTCYRIIRRLVADGTIKRHKDKARQNSVYYSDKDARIVQAALTAEAERRLASLQGPAQPAAASTEPPEPEATEPKPAAAPEETPEEEAPEPSPESKAEPKSISQLAIAPGPVKRTTSKKTAKKPEPVAKEKTKLQEKIKGLSKSVWFYVGTGALLLLAYGWWRARRNRSPVTDTSYDYVSEPPTETGTPTRQTLTDAEQLRKWNDTFKGI